MTNGYNRPVNNVYGDNDAAPVGTGLDIIRKDLREFSEPIVTRLDTLIGVFERQQPERYRNETLRVPGASIAGIVAYPTQILDRTVSLQAWSFIVNNISGYTLYESTSRSYIPPNQLNFVIRGTFATNHIQLWVIGGTDTNGHDIDIVATEERLSPSTGDIDTSGGGIASNVTVIGPLGQAAMAASIPVTLASNQSALAVTGTFWQATQPISGSVVSDNRGAANFHSSQVSIPTTAGGATLLAARATRQSALVTNPDATNPIYISDNATPTTANSSKLVAGASKVYNNVAALYAIATGGAVTTMVDEEWT